MCMLLEIARDMRWELDGWMTSGCSWVGQRVQRVFPAARKGGKPLVVHGTITCWSPAEGDTYPALWRVEHDDGDKEDLDEREVRDALEAASAVPG